MPVPVIPLFAEKPLYPAVPLGDKTAGARSAGQGRPPTGASRASLTEASTLAGWRHGGDRMARKFAILLLAGALSVCMGSGIVVAQTVAAPSPEAADPFAPHIAAASLRFGIPKRWIVAVLRAESAGDTRAISSVGAMGLMQVMPDTWAELRVRYQLGRNPYDPRDNIMAGTAYLRAMWDRYRTIGGMLAAYNAGPGRYDEYLAGVRELPRETRDYVAALAPVLGGKPLAPGTLAGPQRVTDWRDAPLFVTAPAGSEHTPVLHGERSAGAPSDAPAASPGSLAPAPAEALFVVRSGSGGAP